MDGEIPGVEDDVCRFHVLTSVFSAKKDIRHMHLAHNKKDIRRLGEVFNAFWIYPAFVFPEEKTYVGGR